MAGPTVKAVGTLVSTTTAGASISPAWPAGVAAGDFGLLFVSNASDAIPTPSGWTQAPGSPQLFGSSGQLLTNAGLAIFYKFAVGSDPAVSLTNASSTYSALNAVIVTYSGVNTSNPINVGAGADG